MIEIRYVDSGLANNFGTHIEMNKNLLKYPKLHDPILQHELDHTDNRFTLYDLKHDLGTSGVNQWDLIKFIIRHPSSIKQLLPIYWDKNNGIVYDINLSLIYFVLASIIAGSIYIGSIL